MEYEMDLKDLSDAYLNDGAIKELDEVYRKAEAWDKLKEIMITTISMHRTSLPVDKYHGNLLKGQRGVLENVKRKMVELENGEGSQ